MMKIRPGAGAKYATVGDSSDMSELQTFRHYQISQDAQGAAVEVWRSGHEVVCLVWDSVRGSFGELHVSIVSAERQMEVRVFQALVKAAARRGISLRMASLYHRLCDHGLHATFAD
jgi:hypothetical protein